MDTDDFLDEAQHQADMQYLRNMVNQLTWLWMGEDSGVKIKAAWDEITYYGEEPVFTDMIFDRMVAEKQAAND